MYNKPDHHRGAICPKKRHTFRGKRRGANSMGI